MNTRTYGAELFHPLKEAESKHHVASEGWVWRHNVAHKNQPETSGLALTELEIQYSEKPKTRLTDTQLTEMRSSTGIFFTTTSLSYYKRFEKI